MRSAGQPAAFATEPYSWADAHALAEKMSRAWIHFARYGNPNHVDLPRWEPYTEQSGTTMFFDNTCVIRHHHDREFLKITSAPDMSL